MPGQALGDGGGRQHGNAGGVPRPAQDEIDDSWAKLSAGGETIECGWLKDKFGVYWQIAPAVLWEMMKDPDVEKVQRVMSAIFKMVKLDTETLKRAYEGAEMSVS